MQCYIRTMQCYIRTKVQREGNDGFVVKQLKKIYIHLFCYIY